MYTSSKILMGNGGMIKSIVTPETYTDYSAMRGPCPDGFHIPSYNERTSIKAILDAMGAPANSSTFKVPPIGSYYYGYGTEKSRINATGQIRCCNIYSDDNGAMIYNMNAVYAVPKNALMPVRAFKDEPVIPDQSRSVIYDGSSTATGAGIFWSENLGLFSISSDGINWKTLADKNVGATQAGTSKNAACVGYLFQWGNNNGFTYANNPTFPSTTSTQVDTTGYGPGNYYSSNVYYDKGSDGDWSAPSNNNLRGGQTGAIQKHITTKGVVIYPPQEEQTGYQEVEYIESGSDGNSQYIQVSLEYFGGNYGLEIDVSNVGSAEGLLFSYKQSMMRIVRGSIYIDQSMEGGSSYIQGQFNPSIYSIDGRYLYEGEFIDQEVNYDFTLLSDANFKLYSFKVYKDGILYMDMIPCYDRSNGEIGMYDTINDVFYTNQGTGSFIKGPDVV